MFEKYQKGEIAQLMVQVRATQLGYIVSKPAIEARYDLIIDLGSRLERAQVKCADWWTTEESLAIDLRKETRNNGKKRLYTVDQIDAVYAYVPKHNVVLRFEGPVFHNKQSLQLRTTEISPRLMRGSLLLWNFVW